LTAERIAILFGLPVSRDEFELRAQSVCGWDYGSEELDLATLDKAYVQYSPTAEAAELVRTKAEACGASFHVMAQLRDLREAARNNAVLVIVAHWKGAAVSDKDVLDTWRHRLVQAAHDGSEVATILSSRVAESSSKSEFATACNDLISSDRLRPYLPAGYSSGVLLDTLIRHTLYRDLIDEAMRSGLHRGNRLELFDGLHAPEAVDDAIGAAFEGYIDLSCCTSMALGSYLRMTRGDDVRIHVEEDLLVPSHHLQLIAELLRLLSARPDLSYANARVQMSSELHRYRRKGGD
jgi:hypothetical protein